MAKKSAITALNTKWSEIEADWIKDQDQRLSVGLLISNEVSNGLSSRSDREARWDQCETLYFDRPPARTYEPYDGAADAHISIIQTKLDALSSFVLGTIFAPDMPCRAVGLVPTEQSVLRRKEEIVWNTLRHYGFLEKIDAISPIAGYTNSAHMFVYWKDKKLCIEATRPKEVVVYPAAIVENPRDTKMCMRRFWLRRAQVEAMQELDDEGWWSDKPVVSGADTNDEAVGVGAGVSRVAHIDGTLISEPPWTASSHKRPRHYSTDTSDQLVELYQGYFSAPGSKGKESRYYGIVEYRSRVLLYAKEVDGIYATHPGAFKFGYKPETGFGYWSRSSVADNLQTIQLYANELLSLGVDGLRFSVFGTVFASSYTGTSADQRTSPGEIVLGVAVEPQGVMLPRPDLQWLLPFLSYLVQYSDAVAHISVEGAAGQAKSGTTAHEVAARSAGQAAGVGSYIRTFGRTIEEIFAYVEGLVADNIVEFASTDIGRALNISVDEDLKILQHPVKWELAASTPEATPAAQAQYMQSVIMPLKQMFPGAGLDDYETTSRFLELAGRSMGLDTTGLQLPKSPGQQIAFLAQTLGIDPQALAQLIQDGIQNEQAAGTGEAGAGIEQAGMGGALGEDPGTAKIGAGEEPPESGGLGLFSSMAGEGPATDGTY